jgi:sterol 3beta-glucosyltransferase
LLVSAATIAQRRLTAQRLADAIQSATAYHELHYTAAQLGALVAREDGMTALLSTVESLL